ncbi:GNAT family N-acetyltransferase [Falsirhodobacter deserti]|uniref:GNAT family N-acetyltransferase n=1 Tax=Falsirhodobacter deserti TaxID=1365611 RepID=UPI000FE37C37|nr:GNAT family N-acetyltransferase [Falsirhodobacter deserti]
MIQDITILSVPPFSALCNLAFALRREVFVLEQQVPEEEELDEHDLRATHLVAISNGEVVGTLRLVQTEQHVKIGRVAVRMSARGKGIAKAMMLQGMDAMRNQSQDKFYLAAQADKLGFYEKLGFTAFGDMFDDAGIPHLSMRNY